jgi:hypothetical protein
MISLRIIASLRFLCFAALIFLGASPFLRAAPLDASVYYQQRDGWAETMLASRQRLHQVAAATPSLSFASPVIRGRDPALAIEVDIRDFQQLWLLADDGGDGIGCDHSSWGDPVLVDAAGAALPLIQCKPLQSQVGWQRLRINEDGDGKPLQIGAQSFKTGFFAHAESCIGFDLQALRKEHGRDFVSFRASVGIALSGRKMGSCRFRVLPGLDRDSLANALWTLIERDFNEECKAFLRASGQPARAWLLSEEPVIEERAINTLLDALKPWDATLRSAFAELDKNASAEASLARLAFFQRCLNVNKMVGQAEAVFALAEKTLAMLAPLRDLSAEAQAFVGLQQDYAAMRAQSDCNAESIAALVGRCRALRRKVILSHPALDFADIIITQSPPPDYSHMCDQYLGRRRRPGPGLVLLRNWKDKPEPQYLLKDLLPPGVATHPDLSYDGKRVLFSYCDSSHPQRERHRFLIYEYDLEKQQVRQVTGSALDDMAGADGRQSVLIEDFDPCYLPDGDMAFVSTRSQNFGRCHGNRYTPAYLLYRGKLDGSGIRQLSFGEANEWEPSVLNDGRLVFTRWDYINRHDTIYQGLWTMRPDGTGTAHYYGSYTRNPCMTSEALPIPGSPLVVCTAMAHHSYTAGSVITLDVRKGQDGDAPIVRITPEIPFPETEARPTGAFVSPYPLNEDLYLAAFMKDPLAFEGSVQRDAAYGIYLIDRFGGRELIYHDPTVSSYTPIPVQPRPQPPILASMLPENPSSQEGVVFVKDVHISTVPLPRIRSLRINRILLQPTRAKPALSRANNEIIKGIVGTVPVDDEGSSSFRAPACEPLQLQALDEHGMAVLTMRSFIYLQPGENLACVGCHEHRLSAPPQAAGKSKVAFHPIQPPPGPQYPGGFSYARSVQPVLDRHCLSCHGPKRKSGGLDLSGTPEHSYSRSHNALVGKEGMVKIAYRNEETVSSVADDYFARAGKLAPMLHQKHQGVELSPDEFGRIVSWLDLNAQYYGDYSFNRPERREIDPVGEKALRQAVASRFGDDIAAEPFHCLVNPANIVESRVLMAPLARSAGGWEQWTRGAFASKDDPAYAALQTLAEQALKPMPSEDSMGTCNRSPGCRCGCCWVKDAEEEFRQARKQPQ